MSKRIDERMLRAFVIALETKSLRQTASILDTQPTSVSRDIQDLADFVKLELTRIGGDELELTEEGEKFYPIASDFLKEVDGLRARFEEKRTRLIVVTGGSVIEWVLIPQLDQLRAKLPKKSFYFQDEPRDNIIKKLLSCEADFGILHDDPKNNALKAECFGSLSYNLFMRPEEAAQCSKLSEKQLTSFLMQKGRWALLPPRYKVGAAIRKWLTRTANRKRGKLEAFVECNSNFLLARAIQSSNLCAVLPQQACNVLRESAVPVSLPKKLSTELEKEAGRLFLVWRKRSMKVRNGFMEEKGKIFDVLQKAC